MSTPPIHVFEPKTVIGIAEMAVSTREGDVLVTYALGSCLGIAIYDPVAKVGGLMHAMLPDSSIDPQKAALYPAMFIDSGLPQLFRAAYTLKAQKERLLVYAAGGAQIMDSQQFFNIGKRNYEAFSNLLIRNDLQIEAEQIGGLVNRTISLNISTGEVRLKVSGQPNEVTLCKS
ncbi:MAG: cheD [Verrucomicrobiales bacterium]|nr:cheD [Verrucomicrobiales bacterium]MDB6129066.1 cheD [Verrucomicrobiales bacterium]